MAETIAPDIELTAEIVSAYVSKNSVPAAELPALISSVACSARDTAGSECTFKTYEVLNKPFTVEQLERKLRLALEERR